MRHDGRISWWRRCCPGHEQAAAWVCPADCLWTVGFLALLGTQIVAAGRSETQLAGNLKQEAELEAAANGAVENIAFHVLALKDPRFQADGIVRELQIGQIPVLVPMQNESDRINLNTASGALLRALFLEVGSTPALAEPACRRDSRLAHIGASPRPEWRQGG